LSLLGPGALTYWLEHGQPCAVLDYPTPSLLVSKTSFHSLVHHRHARCEHRDLRGLSVPPADSPNAVFPSARINACKHAADSAPTGVRSSERPFAYPQRLRFSAPPFRGQRSRPTPSVPNWLLPGPFGPLAPQPWLVRPSHDCFNASDPLPDLHQSAPAFSNASAPL
jgi:hypothetical protein